MAVFFLSVVHSRLDTLSACRSRTTWKGRGITACDVHVPGQSWSYVCIMVGMVSQAFSYFARACTEPLQSSAKLDKSCSGLGSIKIDSKEVYALTFIKDEDVVI